MKLLNKKRWTPTQLRFCVTTSNNLGPKCKGVVPSRAKGETVKTDVIDQCPFLRLYKWTRFRRIRVPALWRPKGSRKKSRPLICMKSFWNGKSCINIGKTSSMTSWELRTFSPFTVKRAPLKCANIMMMTMITAMTSRRWTRWRKRRKKRRRLLDKKRRIKRP